MQNFLSHNRRKVIAALLLLANLGLNGARGVEGIAPATISATSNAPASEEIRGVWIWGATVAHDGAEKVAERLASHHINRAFLLVKGLSGDVCFQSKLAPSPRSGADTLREFLDACHKRKIQVHAWFVFNADNHWGREHPEEAMYHAGKPEAWEKGPFSKKDDAHKIPICPASVAYRTYVTNLVREVLDHYDVDGIHLDYIRYGHVCYCFCPRHQALAAARGINLERVRQAVYETYYAPKKKSDRYFQLYRQGDPDIVGWVTLRQEEINQAVKEIKQIVKGKNPSLTLSAAFMPEGGEVDDTFALCHYAQNYATAGADLDYILPMTYGKTAQWAARIALNAEKKSHHPVYSGLWAGEQPGTFDVSDSVKNRPEDVPGPHGAAAPLASNIRTIRRLGVHGFVLFHYGSITDSMWNTLP